jgi:hypothetical protein
MATLKISELSVGDWVRTKDGNVTVDIISPHEVVVMNDYGNLCACKIEDIEPIPITAETLEKNGFENMGSGLMRYEFELREKKYKIILGSLDEEVWFADFYFMRKKNIDSNIPLFYIHQLQHILRIAGVDKEINL